MTPHALITALEASGLTQRQIAAHAGVTRQTISNWKSGRTTMPYTARMALKGLLKERKKDE